MITHELLGGKLHVYKRENSSFWQCSTYLKGRNHRTTTKEERLAHAKQIAEDWYLELRGKARAGLLRTEKTFELAANQFLKEYEIITENQRSPRWIEGHGIRLRLHLVPFFGDLGVSEVTPGNRIATSSTGKAPARSTIHDEIVTLRQVLKTAIRHGWLSHLPDLSPPYKTHKARSSIALGSAPQSTSNSTKPPESTRASPPRNITRGTPSKFTTTSCSWPTPACGPTRRRTCNTAMLPSSRTKRPATGF